MAGIPRVIRWAAAVLPLAVVFIGVPGRSLALDPAVLPSQYRYRSWYARDGLPQSSVMAMARDRRGYLWVGTQSGLARFDGSAFTLFDELSTPAIHGSVVLSLTASGDRLWIGTTEGLSMMVGDEIHRIPLPGAGVREGVMALKRRADGSVLAGTARGRVYEALGKTATLLAEIPLTRERPAVEDFLEFPDGEIWVGTDQGLWRLTTDGPEPVLWTGGETGTLTVFALESMGEGRVLAATEEALFTIRRKGTSVEVNHVDLPGLGSSMVRCLERDRDGTLWVGTLGAGTYRGAHGEWVRMTPREWPDLKAVRCLLADAEGILWIGSLEHGLHLFADSPFLNYDEAEGLQPGSVRSVAASGTGELWVGSEGGLSLIAGGRVHRPDLPPDLLRQDTMSLLVVGDGSLWIGTNGAGVVRVRGTAVTRWGTPEGLPHDVVAVLFEDRDGRIWAGTDGGVALFEGGGWRAFSVAEGLPGNVVSSLAQAPDGSILAGTMNGLARLEGRGFVPWGKGAPEGPITALWFDPQGDLWVAVEGRGVGLVDGTGTHSMDRRWGFPQRTVGAMGLGRDGNLWFAGMQGLCSVPWRALKNHLQGKGPRPRFRWATVEDGLRTTECSTVGQPSMSLGSDGTVCVATVEGVSCLPGGVPPPPPIAHGPLIVEGLQVDGVPVSLNGPVRLKAGLRALELRFASPSFLFSEGMSYSVRLEGLEAGWRDVGKSRKVVYTHLPPGQFVFHVRTMTPAGVSLHDGADLAFTVLPPPWQTPWVLALAAFIFFAAGPALYFYRVTALKRRQEQLWSLVEERTAELRQTAAALERMTLEDPLTGIPNYRAFHRDLALVWRNALRQGEPVSVIMADIDFFKVFNDAFGHLHGDECLRRVAAALRSCVHRPGDLVARYGGEEFVALLPGTDEEGAWQLAEQMRRAVEALQIGCPRPDGGSVVTASFGVASQKPEIADRSGLLVLAADRALYRAKGLGRNRAEMASAPSGEPTGQYRSAVDEGGS